MLPRADWTVSAWYHGRARTESMEIGCTVLGTDSIFFTKGDGLAGGTGGTGGTDELPTRAIIVVAISAGCAHTTSTPRLLSPLAALLRLPTPYRTYAPSRLIETAERSNPSCGSLALCLLLSLAFVVTKEKAGTPIFTNLEAAALPAPSKPTAA